MLGKKEIVKTEYPYLLGTLPYRTAVKGATFAATPDSYRHKLSFNVKKDTVDLSAYDPDAPAPVDNSLRISKSLAELAGKKITLSYSPATAQDEAIINAYLPSPHADGSPIQPSELPSQLPAYLINVKSELRIDGQVVATGEPIGLGATNIFTMTFSDPAYGSSQIVNNIDAGVYQAIGLNLGRISQEQLTVLKAKLEATKVKLQNNDFGTLSKDDLVGDLLYTTALAYHAELGTMNYITARTMGVNALTLPSETIFATKLKVMMFFGMPRWVQPGGLNMDADYLMQVVKSRDGNGDTAKNYMLGSGMTSSTLEHSVPEQLFSTPDNPAEGISTVKALKIANDQGIPIYSINLNNIATILPQLQIDQQTKDDIANAVNAGKVITVSKTNITFNGWTGCGYIISNPETGAGAYMISGGLNGGDTNLDITGNMWGFLDSIGTGISIQFSVMAKVIGEYGKNLFDAISKKVGVLMSIVQWFQDLNDINNKPNSDAMQWLCAYLVISSCLLLAVALTLAIPAEAPVLVAIGVVVLGTIVINLLKAYLLEHIYSYIRKTILGYEV